MKTLDDPLRGTQALPWIGLESALTSALSCAQLAAQPDVCDRLLALKRDVMARRRRAEAPTFDPVAA